MEHAETSLEPTWCPIQTTGLSTETKLREWARLMPLVQKRLLRIILTTPKWRARIASQLRGLLAFEIDKASKTIVSVRSSTYVQARQLGYLVFHGPAELNLMVIL